jgi:hypothetical protein
VECDVADRLPDREEFAPGAELVRDEFPEDPAGRFVAQKLLDAKKLDGDRHRPHLDRFAEVIQIGFARHRRTSQPPGNAVSL